VFLAYSATAKEVVSLDIFPSAQKVPKVFQATDYAMPHRSSSLWCVCARSGFWRGMDLEAYVSGTARIAG
jgi:hypothetical protein